MEKPDCPLQDAPIEVQLQFLSACRKMSRTPSLRPFLEETLKDPISDLARKFEGQAKIAAASTCISNDWEPSLDSNTLIFLAGNSQEWTIRHDAFMALAAMTPLTDDIKASLVTMANLETDEYNRQCLQKITAEIAEAEIPPPRRKRMNTKKVSRSREPR